jgi:hypothetical protein
MSTALLSHPLQISRAAPVRRLSLFPLLFTTVTLIGMLAGIETAHRIQEAPRLTMRLTVREYRGQLLIGYVPALFGSRSARLEILDGNRVTSISFPNDISEITYARQSNDVEVRLIAGAERRVLRFLAQPEPGPPPVPPQLSHSMQKITAQAHRVRIRAEDGLDQLAGLQRRANTLLRLTAARSPAPRSPNLRTTRFWR